MSLSLYSSFRQYASVSNTISLSLPICPFLLLYICSALLSLSCLPLSQAPPACHCPSVPLYFHLFLPLYPSLLMSASVPSTTSLPLPLCPSLLSSVSAPLSLFAHVCLCPKRHTHQPVNCPSDPLYSHLPLALLSLFTQVCLCSKSVTAPLYSMHLSLPLCASLRPSVSAPLSLFTKKYFLNLSFPLLLSPLILPLR